MAHQGLVVLFILGVHVEEIATTPVDRVLPKFIGGRDLSTISPNPAIFDASIEFFGDVYPDGALQ